MPAILSSIWSFLVAHPELLVPAIASLLSFALSFLQGALTKSPRLSAAYSLLCKLFPDLTDPKALAADLWALVSGGKGPPPPALGVLFALAVGATAAVVAPGCAWLSSPEAKVVEQDAAKVAECVIPKLVTGESPEQIAIECAVDLLTVQRIAAAHRAGALKACPAPAVSR